jgi:hypothetical protein
LITEIKNDQFNPYRFKTVIVLTILVFITPVFLDLIFSGAQSIFRYSAPDSFYYHTIARNFAETGIFSYDSERITNGFQPLWQLVLGCLYWVYIQIGITELSYLYTSLIINCLLIASSIIFLAYALKGAKIRINILFLFLPFGIYALLILPYWFIATYIYQLQHWSQGTFPLFGTLWSFVNGMESSLVIFFYSALAYFFINNQFSAYKKTILIGVSSSLLCLSRLDHGLVLLPFVIYYLIEAIKTKEKKEVINLFIFSFFFGVPILIYLLINLTYTESVLPFSGVAKSSFPNPNINNLENISFVFKDPYTSGRSMSSFYRASQLIIPMIFALIQLILFIKEYSKPKVLSNWSLFLGLSACGVMLLFLYNFLFVKAFDMGHWYFPVSILFVTLCTISWCKNNPFKPSKFKWLLSMLLICSLFLFFHRREDHHWLYAQMYLIEGPEVKLFYQGKEPKLIEVDDGIIAFSTGFKALSGTGLALDKESFLQKQKGLLNQHGLKLGFDRKTTLVYQLPKYVHQSGKRPPGKKAAVEHITKFKKSNKNFSYEIEYISESGYFWILKLSKKLNN